MAQKTIWLKDDFAAGQMPTAGWCNQVARWHNHFTAWLPIVSRKTPWAWTLGLDKLQDESSYQEIGFQNEGTEAADSTDFVIGTNDKGLKLWFMTRWGYWHGGDKVLYGFIRDLRLTRYGLGYYIGPETRITLDTAGPCS